MAGEYNPLTQGFNLRPDEEARLADTQARRQAQMARQPQSQQPSMPQGLLGTKFTGDDLLALGQGLLSAGNWERTPVSNAAAMSAGFENFQRQRQQQKLNSFKERELGLDEQMYGLKRDEFTQKGKERKMYKDLNGRQKYVDTNEFVNPGAEKEADQTTLYKNAVAAGLTPGTPGFMEFMRVNSAKGPLVNIEGDRGWKVPANHMPNPNYDPNRPPTEENNPVMLIPGTKQQGDIDRKYKEGIKNYENLELALGEYQKALDKYGPQMMMGGLNAENALRIGAPYTAVMVQLKNLYELGALQQPDIDLLEGIMINPQSKTAWVANKAGQNPIQASIDSMRKEVANRRITFDKEYGKSGSSGPGNNKPMSEWTTEELKAFIEEAEK